MTDINSQVTVTPPSTRRPDDAPVETTSRVRASDIIGPAVVFVLFTRTAKIGRIEPATAPVNVTTLPLDDTATTLPAPPT